MKNQIKSTESFNQKGFCPFALQEVSVLFDGFYHLKIRKMYQNIYENIVNWIDCPKTFQSFAMSSKLIRQIARKATETKKVEYSRFRSQGNEIWWVLPNGWKHGNFKSAEWRSLDSNTKIKITTFGFYENNKKSGLWLTFVSEPINKRHFPTTKLDVKLRYQCSWINNKKHGELKRWDSKGVLREYRQFKNGKLHGDYKLFYCDGRLREETFYANGKLHNTSTKWYPNGTILSQTKYRYGRIPQH
jgi:antitoxin component YwqK of YwqJK toxin-antitoxin module